MFALSQSTHVIDLWTVILCKIISISKKKWQITMYSYSDIVILIINKPVILWCNAQFIIIISFSYSNSLEKQHTFIENVLLKFMNL